MNRFLSGEPALGVSMRSVQPQDMDFVALMGVEAAVNPLAPPTEESKAEFYMRVCHVQQDPAEMLGGLVAEYCGRPVAAAWLRWVSPLTGLKQRVHREAYEVLIGVEEAARGRRIGTMLLNELIGAAEDGGVPQLYLEVIDVNTPARRLYEGSGFRAIGGESYPDIRFNRTAMVLDLPVAK